MTSTTVTNASGNNWSKSFSSGSTTSVTYNFRIHYDGELGVDGSRSVQLAQPGHDRDDLQHHLVLALLI